MSQGFVNSARNGRTAGAGLLARMVMTAMMAMTSMTAGFPARLAHAQEAASGPPLSAGAEPSADELAELWALRSVLRRFEVAAQAHDERLASSRTPRPRELAEQALAGTGLGRRAIMARLEAYLAGDPGNAERAPEAMMLLAGLYLAADEDAVPVDEAGDESGDEPGDEPGDESGDESGDDSAERGMRAAMELWDGLARRFPQSRLAAEALAELAQAHFDLGEYEPAKQAYQRLVCGNRGGELAVAQEAREWADDELSARIYTNSVRVADYEGCVAITDDSELIEAAWMRLGSLHRSTYGEAELAISALSQIAGNPRSEVYATALQELASAYLDSDKLIEAIPVLDDLIMHLDRVNARANARHNARANARLDAGVSAGGADDAFRAEIRAESVTRVGHILALLWRESAISDPDSARRLAAIYYSRGRRHQDHVRAVFDALGEALREHGAFDQAVPVWRHVLDLWPLDGNAPVVHDKLVKLLIAKGDSRAADDERRRLVEQFGPGTRWVESNRDHAGALAGARAVVEQNLYELAASQVRQATIAFEDTSRGLSGSYAGANLPAAVVALYDDARTSIERFITEYPDSKHTYEMQYLRARVLYYSRRWVDAARAFAVVQSQGRDRRYYEEATSYRMYAYADELGERMRSGALVLPPVPEASDLAGDPAPRPAPGIDDIYDDLIAAYDAYEGVVTSQLQAAMVAMQAAELDLRYLRVDRAEKRFAAIIDRYCHTYLAREAHRQLFALHRARGRDDAAVALDASFAAQGCADSSQPAQTAQRLVMSRQYSRGEELVAAGKHLEAGQVFLDVYRETAPSSEFHDKALFGAARAFASGGRHDLALDLFAEFDRRAELHASPLYAEAMWRKARAHERGFDSEAAVAAYLRVAGLRQSKQQRASSSASSASPSPEASFDLERAARDSLWRAAELLDEERIYYDRGAGDPGAATLYLRAAGQGKDTAGYSTRAYLAAARVYRKAGDTAALVRVYRDWRTRHGAGTALHHVHFHALIASALEGAGDRRGAARHYAELVDAYVRAGGKPGTAEAELAGQAQFWLAEDAYQSGLRAHRFEWSAERGAGDGSASVASAAAALERMAEQARAGFVAVERFGSSWTVAARVRQGDAWLDYANKIIDAPPPRWLSDLDAERRRGMLEQYADELTRLVEPHLVQARAAWTSALELARQRGGQETRDRWSRLAARRLRAHGGAAFQPLLRDEIVIREPAP